MKLKTAKRIGCSTYTEWCQY